MIPTGDTEEIEALRGQVKDYAERLARISIIAHDEDGDTLEKRSQRLGQCARIAFLGLPDVGAGRIGDHLSLAAELTTLCAENERLKEDAEKWRNHVKYCRCEYSLCSYCATGEIPDAARQEEG